MYLKKLPFFGDRKMFLIRRYCQGKILNIGCGSRHIKGAVNLDRDPKCKPDVVADFHQLPFEDNQFDTVLGFDIIEHTDKPEILVNEMKRVAKPEGTVIIACNDFDIQHQNWEKNPEHVTYFNSEIFKKFFEPKGFSVFSLYRGVLVAVNKSKVKKFNKGLSILYAFYRRPLNILLKRIYEF